MLGKVGRFFKKVGKGVASVPGRIDAKVEEEIREKTEIATIAALDAVDVAAPVLGAILDGEEVELHASVTVKLRLVPKG